MTTTYTLRDGDRVVATSPADFVHQLHIGSRFDYEGSDADYMQRFAKRLQELEGYTVRTDTPENFLSDLLDRGFVTTE